MTVIAFRRRSEAEQAGWTPEERNLLVKLQAARARRGETVEAAVATTERQDPQFFLLGPGPDHECILSISRVAGRYIMEDGNGRVLLEADELKAIAVAAERLRLHSTYTSLVARLLIGWCVLYEFVEERTDMLLEEAVEVTEVFGHIVPQIAVLA